MRAVTSGADICAQPCYISYCLENQMNQVLLYTGRTDAPTESMKLICAVCFPAGANAVAGYCIHLTLLVHFTNLKNELKMYLLKKDQFICKFIVWQYTSYIVG